MDDMKNSPVMGEMPKSNSNDCDGTESPLFLSHAEAAALFNAVGFCCTSIKAMQCVVQEPIISVLADEEMSIYSEIRKKLYVFLGAV